MYLFSSSAINWLQLILKERFGLDFYILQENLSLKLSLTNCPEKYILFPLLEKCFHQTNNHMLCEHWAAENEGWFSILDKPLPAPSTTRLTKPLIQQKTNYFIINYDILGLAYWMLNRMEEIGKTENDLDQHQRFPAISSHAYQHGYLERPIVDEWLHILGQVIRKQWPKLKLKEHKYSIKVSHDVDSPSLYQFKPWNTIFKMMGSSLIKRRDLISFFQAPYIKLTNKSNLSSKDPYNTFLWLMDQSEYNNIKSSFYFMTGCTDKVRDAEYEITHPSIRYLIREIHARGHEIGLHPSYNSYQSPLTILNEANALRRIMESENITQKEIGGRMHYLRWDHPHTLQAWNDANLTYDSTLGYADHPGFRCGTCFEYPGYNPLAQEILDIRIRPLVVMEQSIISKLYLDLGFSKEAESKFLQLKKVCQQLGGSFTILWHNSSFPSPEAFKLYQQVINCD